MRGEDFGVFLMKATQYFPIFFSSYKMFSKYHLFWKLGIANSLYISYHSLLTKTWPVLLLTVPSFILRNKIVMLITRYYGCNVQGLDRYWCLAKA